MTPQLFHSHSYYYYISVWGGRWKLFYGDFPGWWKNLFLFRTVKFLGWWKVKVHALYSVFLQYNTYAYLWIPYKIEFWVEKVEFSVFVFVFIKFMSFLKLQLPKIYYDLRFKIFKIFSLKCYSEFLSNVEYKYNNRPWKNIKNFKKHFPSNGEWVRTTF